MSLFSSLYTSYSGLQVSQGATDIISNNIANAENEDYSRQRVNVASKSPIKMAEGNIGTGAEVEQIVRVHDEFTYKRYRAAGGTLEKDQFMEKTLVEVSELFPDVDQAGIEKDLNNYFEAWQKLASNPADDAQKIILAANAGQLSRSINETFIDLKETQYRLDEQLDAAINEVNRLGEQIARLNNEIPLAELRDYDRANTLRDERDKLEIAMTKLIAPNIIKTGTQAISDVDMNIADYDEHYSILVGGFQIVDGKSFHPLVVDKDRESDGGFSTLYFQKSDYTMENINKAVESGKVGAILDLRGRSFDGYSGEFEDGKLQEYMDMLDTLAKGIMQSTNTIYAGSSDNYMESNTIGETVTLGIEERKVPLGNLYPEKLQNKVLEGDMVISVYDISGKYLKDVKITLAPETQTIHEVIDTINAAFVAEAVDAKAEFRLGTIDISSGGTNNGDEIGTVLVKEDNSLITQALDITAYRDLQKVDSLDIPYTIENGSFKINVYDENGVELASREVLIDKESDNPMYSSIAGIVEQVKLVHIDDNKDNDFTNDVDDLIDIAFSDNRLKIITKDKNSGVQFNITDDSTGFSGAIGVHKFFEGDSAKTMSIAQDFKDSAAAINAYGKAVEGDNEIANKMQQLQYDKVYFYERDGDRVDETIMGQYRYTTGIISSDTEIIQIEVENSQAVYESIKKRHQQVSAVNIDEELANLIKYQTGYGANARVMSSIQTMLDTLLGIKQ